MSRKRTTPDGKVSGNGSTALPPLPTGWSWAKVHEVGEVKLGRQRSPEHHHGKHMRPYLRVANVYEDRIDLSDVMEMNFTPVEFETYKLQHGDILLNEGQSLEWVGRPAMYRDDLPGACFQNTLVRFRPGPVVLPAYALLIFRHYLHSQRFQRIAKWTVNIAHLGASRFAELDLPVPPINEQKRIVEKFDELSSELDAGVATLKRVRQALKRYRSSVLKTAVEGKLTQDWRAKNPDTEPASVMLERLRFNGTRRRTRRGVPDRVPFSRVVEKIVNPEKWALCSVAELLQLGAIIDLKDGNHGTNHPKRNEFSAEGLPFITASEVNRFRIDYENAPKLSGRPLEKLNVGFAEPGDVILTHKGTVGRVAINVRPCVLSPQTTYYRLSDSIIDRCYLAYFLLSHQFYSQLADVKSQTTRDYVPISDQYRMFILIPPYHEQRQIVSEVDRRLSIVDEVEAQVEANIKRATHLRLSSLKRAFEGRLVPQEPDDEPAEMLLGRLRIQGASEKSVSGSPSKSGHRSPRSRNGLPLFDQLGTHPPDNTGE